jgi:uncharacterized membrane protein YphA (DoxX/SURF4 family)
MRTATKYSTHGARVLLGLIFTVFGLNGFLQFLPMPPMPGPAGEFLGALAATGYMFPLIKGTELIAGLMLLSGRLVPLALTLLAPIVVNIAAFHLVLTPFDPMSLVLVALEIYLAWSYRNAFRSVLDLNAKPVQSLSTAPRGQWTEATS